MPSLLCAGVGSLNERVARLWLQENAGSVIGLRFSAEDKKLGFQQMSVDLSASLWPDTHADYVVVALSARERSVEGYRLAYVDPIKNLAESLKTWHRLPKRVIVVSSTRVYGANNGEHIDDSTLAKPTDEYGEILSQMEGLVSELPVESVVVRLSGIYGPGRDWLKRQAVSATPESQTKNHWTNRIHIDDAARAINFLLHQKTVEKSYIVSDQQPMPLLDMFAYFRARAGLSPLRLDIPVEGGKRLQPTRLTQAGFQWLYPTALSGGYE